MFKIEQTWYNGKDYYGEGWVIQTVAVIDFCQGIQRNQEDDEKSGGHRSTKKCQDESGQEKETRMEDACHQQVKTITCKRINYNKQ